MEDLAAALAGHPFLAGLKSDQVKLLAECASSVSFPVGQYLCRGAEEAAQFFLIQQGRVGVEIFRARKGAVTTQTVGEGEALGWLWFEKPYHWHYDARAQQLTRALALDVKGLMARCEANRELGYELMKRYAHMLGVQFRVMILQLVDMYDA